MRSKAPKTMRGMKEQDVVLCTLTNKRAGRALTETFIALGIPFTETWRRVPSFLRGKGISMQEICTVRTHRSQYSRARQTLDQMGRPFLLMVNINII